MRPEHRLTLLLAATAERRAQAGAEIAALAAAADPHALAEVLAAQRLLPLLGGRLLAAAGAPSATAGWEAFAARVAAATDAARAHAQAHELITAMALGALAQAGVRGLALKGPRLARRAHGDPALRTSSDLDLLVARADLEPAVAALATVGWAPPPTPGPADLHVALAGADGLPHVDLHWRIHWYEDAFSRRLLDAADAGGDLPWPEELAAVLLYHARDGFAGLRYPADAAALHDRAGGADLTAILADHPRLAPALRAAAAALDLPLAPSPRRRERAATRLADPLLDHDPDQIRAVVSLVDALLLPRGATRAYVRRTLDPPATATTPARRAAWRLQRTVKFTLRWVRAAATAVASP